MLTFHDKVDRSIKTLATCRQRGGRFGRESVPVARGRLQKRCCERPLAVDHHRACRSCPQAAETKLKQCLKDSGGPGSTKVSQSSSWSPTRKKFLIVARLRRSLASTPTTPNMRSVRCMAIFHNKIDRSLETLASCRQRGGGFGRGSVPVARGKLQTGTANDPWRSATTARAVRVRELPRASPNLVKKIPEAPGAQRS